MTKDLAQEAIAKALSGEWEEAIAINKKILLEKPKDIASLNRLARAYAELGDLESAKKHAKSVLKLDPFNPIATKALAKWRGLRKGESPNSQGGAFVEMFIEEPGKTKIVSLLHLGSKKTIATLDAGDRVKISSSNHRVSISTTENKYIGRLSDDLSARLRKLIRHGNEYEAFVKSVTPEDVRVFIKEVKRSPELADIASFSGDKVDYVSFTPPELVHKRHSATEEEGVDEAEE